MFIILIHIEISSLAIRTIRLTNAPPPTILPFQILTKNE